MYVYMIRDTTGRPVSDNALTPTRTHIEMRDGDSAGSTQAFHEAEAAFQSLLRTTKENDDRGEEAPFLVRQHFVLDKTQYKLIPFPSLL